MSVFVARARRAAPAETAFRYGPVLVAAALFALPIFWVLVVSLKKQSEYSSSLFPAVPQFVNYELAVVLAGLLEPLQANCLPATAIATESMFTHQRERRRPPAPSVPAPSVRPA